MRLWFWVQWRYGKKEASGMRDIHPASGPCEAERPARGRTERALMRALAASEADVAGGRVVPMAETFRKARKMLKDMRASGKIR